MTLPEIIIEDRATEVKIGTVPSRSFIEYKGDVWVVGNHDSHRNEDQELERVTYIHELAGEKRTLPFDSNRLVIPLQLVEAKFTR